MNIEDVTPEWVEREIRALRFQIHRKARQDLAVLRALQQARKMANDYSADRLRSEQTVIELNDELLATISELSNEVRSLDIANDQHITDITLLQGELDRTRKRLEAAEKAIADAPRQV